MGINLDFLSELRSFFMCFYDYNVSLQILKHVPHECTIYRTHQDRQADAQVKLQPVTMPRLSQPGRIG